MYLEMNCLYLDGKLKYREKISCYNTESSNFLSSNFFFLLSYWYLRIYFIKPKQLSVPLEKGKKSNNECAVQTHHVIK